MPRLLRASLIAVPAVALASVAGCNALSGVNNLTEVGDGWDAAAPDAYAPSPESEPPPQDGRTHDFDAIAQDDSSLPADAGTVDANAGLCTQLTMLLRLDGTTTSSQGSTPVAASGVSYVAGKYGQALSAVGATGVDYDAVGGTVVSSQQGTISLWLSPQWPFPCSVGRPFFGIDNNGLYADCEPPGYIGAYVDLSASSSVVAAIAPNGAQAVWTTSWNHLVATWSQSPPSLTITLNGSVGQQTNVAWTPPDPVAAVFHVANSAYPSGAYIDDVAVWTRPLSAAEIHTVNLANASVGDLCALR